MDSPTNWSTTKIAVAGLAGGAAEVLWIWLVGGAFGTESWQVSRAVTATVAPSYSASAAAPWWGLAIHFLLSFALAATFASTLGRRLHGAALFATAIGALAAVWAFNFLVLLPAINPAFTELLPHPVTLVSKLLFGVAMAAVLARKTAVVS
jgi:hypothetical protein